MTVPAPETLEREQSKLYVTDAELIRRLGVPERSARELLKVLQEHRSFPKYGIFGKRRYWPAVHQWIQDHPDYQGRKAAKSKVATAQIGNVYFLATATHVKIGFSAAGVDKRTRAIRQNHHEELKLLAVLKSVPRYLEGCLHEKFAAFHVKGEWFTRAPEIEEFLAKRHLGHWRKEFLP